MSDSEGGDSNAANVSGIEKWRKEKQQAIDYRKRHSKLQGGGGKTDEWVQKNKDKLQRNLARSGYVM